jgi:hypothetical protein
VKLSTKTLFILLLTTAAACGGPALVYDQPPSPGWITKPPTGIGSATLTAVGSAPATIEIARDSDLATRNAKSRVAQLFESKINSRLSDWTLAMTGGAADVSLDGATHSIEVRSTLTVEGASVQSEYRDEQTRTHYAKILVDRVAWAQRLHGRIGDGFEKFEANLASAQKAVDARKPLSALKFLLQASREGQKIEPDVTAIDLLDNKAGIRTKLDKLRGEMDQLSRKLRSEYKFALTIKSPDPQAARQLQANLEQFLANWGFSVGKVDPNTIKLDITIAQHNLDPEQVAGRTEYVNAGTGTLNAKDADGTEVPELTVKFKSNRYKERDTDPKKAATKALSLAADTLSSKFRSAFRNAYSQ